MPAADHAFLEQVLPRTPADHHLRSANRVVRFSNGRSLRPTEIATVASVVLVLVVVLVLDLDLRAGRLEWSRFSGQASTVFVPEGTE